VTHKRIAQLQKDLDRIEIKLANEEFLAKAPPEEVAKQQARAEELREEIHRLNRLS